MLTFSHRALYFKRYRHLSFFYALVLKSPDYLVSQKTFLGICKFQYGLSLLYKTTYGESLKNAISFILH